MVNSTICDYTRPASSSYPKAYNWIANTYTTNRTNANGDSNNIMLFNDSGIEYYSAHKQRLSRSASAYEHNARVIFDMMTGLGWTPNAACALLGNVQEETAMNPGAWEGYKNRPKGYVNFGIGIVQWSNPNYKYTNELYNIGGADLLNRMYSLPVQCQFLEWMASGVVEDDWKEFSGYELSFYEFSRSTKHPGYLGEVFARNYERSAAISGQYGKEEQKKALAKRNANALAWWEKFVQYDEPTPDPEPPTPDPEPPTPDPEPEPEPKPDRHPLFPWFLYVMSKKRRVRK